MNNASKGHCVTVTPQGKQNGYLSASGSLGNDNQYLSQLRILPISLLIGLSL